MATIRFFHLIQHADFVDLELGVLSVMVNDAYLWIIPYSQHCFLLNFLFYSRKAYLAHQYKKILCHPYWYRITIDENPIPLQRIARRGGAEVAGWTLDRKIWVWFPAYPHRVWALWWQGGKGRLRTSRCPCRGRLGMLKTPSCQWRGCPAAGQNLETGHLSRHYIAEISLNVTLNQKQQQLQRISVFSYLCLLLTKVLFETSFKSFQYNTECRRLSNYSIKLILYSHYRSF